MRGLVFVILVALVASPALAQPPSDLNPDVTQVSAPPGPRVQPISVQEAVTQNTPPAPAPEVTAVSPAATANGGAPVMLNLTGIGIPTAEPPIQAAQTPANNMQGATPTTPGTTGTAPVMATTAGPTTNQPTGAATPTTGPPATQTTSNIPVPAPEVEQPVTAQVGGGTTNATPSPVPPPSPPSAAPGTTTTAAATGQETAGAPTLAPAQTTGGNQVAVSGARQIGANEVTISGPRRMGPGGLGAAPTPENEGTTA